MPHCTEKKKSDMSQREREMDSLGNIVKFSNCNSLKYFCQNRSNNKRGMNNRHVRENYTLGKVFHYSQSRSSLHQSGPLFRSRRQLHINSSTWTESCGLCVSVRITTMFIRMINEIWEENWAIRSDSIAHMEEKLYLGLIFLYARWQCMWKK